MSSKGVKNWELCLKIIFDLPASIILIVGKWKTGKTDFSLLIAEELKRLGIIKKVASNIKTKDSNVENIEDMPSLRMWMFGDKISKLFIYDESITATPKRRAMSKLNVAWLKEIIPELSKGKGKLIVITQEMDFTESIFYHPTFSRGMFKKINKKTAILNSPLLKKEEAFFDIPRTNIQFDPYRIAIFRAERILNGKKLTDGQRVRTLYSRGQSYATIGKTFTPPKHKEEVKRIMIKELARLEEISSQVTYNSAMAKATSKE